MADAFKPGDLVQLKSGGPVMTVVEYGDYGEGRRCHCTWFDDKKKLTDGYFVDAVLKLIS
jgi:uncharacterized protein YodC (DUF2158 family)